MAMAMAMAIGGFLYGEGRKSTEYEEQEEELEGNEQETLAENRKA